VYAIGQVRIESRQNILDLPEVFMTTKSEETVFVVSNGFIVEEDGRYTVVRKSPAGRHEEEAVPDGCSVLVEYEPDNQFCRIVPLTEVVIALNALDAAPSPQLQAERGRHHTRYEQEESKKEWEMNEQELSEMAVLERSAQSLTGRFKEYHVKLEQVAAELALDREKLNGREKELNEREMKITRREAEVGAIRQIAADRKVQVEVAQAASTKANEMRKDA
jgi:hypothetical protein